MKKVQGGLRLLAYVATALALAVFLSACGSGGAMEVQGIKLANELNPPVTVGEKAYRVGLVVADNKSDKVEAANAAQRLVDKDKVNVVLG
jgi:branched-chain amino acid transport system substrate-binding protein